MADFEVVDRDVADDASSSIDPKLIAALIETADSGRAVKIDMNGKHLINWQSTMRNRLAKKGFRMRYKFDKKAKTLLAWAEKGEVETSEGFIET